MNCSTILLISGDDAGIGLSITSEMSLAGLSGVEAAHLAMLWGVIQLKW